MDWRRLDFPTRAGFVATVMAVLAVVIPPVSVVSSVVAIAYSKTAVGRARRAGSANRVAVACLAVSAGMLVLIVIGSAIYAAGS